MQVNYGAGLEADHNLHLSAHAHYETPNTSGSAFAPFRHSAVPAIDPSLDATAGAARHGHTPMSSLHQPPNHLLPPDNASLQGQHLSHAFYDMSRPSQTPSTPSNASPRFAQMSPAGQPKQMAAPYLPTDRALPSRDVSDDTLNDAYAAFILYCNPSFNTATDITELTKAFRLPPKSDGNSFSTWRLFELIRKLDSKEIPTWAQLALDLGVERPDLDKGQSTQKVQQYSVRLKRWMHAMHIDAFFEYLLGKQHPYYVQIPPPDHPFPENGRDGVPLEEDLALRALDSRFRPKRGRRRADEGEDDAEPAEGTPPRKRPQLDTSIPFGNMIQPQSAYPSSAHPDHMEGFLSHDPWTSAMTPASAMTAASAPGRLKNLTPYSASPMSGGQMRWRLNTHDNPTTPYPQSAVTPMSAHPDYYDEPQSAVTPSTSKVRSRRRHGPAVSSAWPSNTSSSTGKLRGRPPSNRSVRDGPFVTFPANPKTKEGPTIDMNRNSANLTPIVERAQSDPPMPEPHLRFPPTPASAISPTNMDGALQSNPQKPHRLSLQVPQIVGNPVRLVTPTVLVNGEDATSGRNLTPSAIPADSLRSSPATYFSDNTRNPHPTPISAAMPKSLHRPRSQPTAAALELPNISLEALNRALAAELIRAHLLGRRKRLRSTEAKNLASSILAPLYAKPGNAANTSASALGKAMNEAMLGVVISSCLGLCSAVGLGAGGPSGGVKRVECVRVRVGGDGYESLMDDDDDEEGTRDGQVKESFSVFFEVQFGGLAGEWVVKDLSAAGSLDAEGDDEGDVGRDGEGDEDEEDWKAKFVEMRSKFWESQEREREIKERVLEAVL